MSEADELDEGQQLSRKNLGPLGPWRLSLAIGASAIFTGMPLLDAVTTGGSADMALLRSFGVAFLTWVALGALNRALFHIPPSAGRSSDSAQEVHQ